MTDWATGTCEANGIDVHYLRTGGECSFWKFTVLNGIILGDEENRTSSIFAITAKKKFLEKFLNILD